MKNVINVVSFFDGMGCLYVALKELGVPIESYHAYEIDKHAMKAAKALNPNVIHKGDVRFFDIKDYPDGIQIFAGGSPCTDLSFAGTMSGLICNSLPEYIELRNEYLETKDENLFFHNGKFQQSILFWEWLRALKEIQKVNPKVYFLLENVIMPKVHENTISKELGIAPIRLNANLVSAQNRDRLFWSNISLEPFGLFGDLHCTIQQPRDRGILLKHILESDVKEKYYLSEKIINKMFQGLDLEGKANCLRTTGHCSQSNKHNFDLIKEFPVCVASRGRNPENPKSRESGLETEQMLEPRIDGKTNCLTSVQKDNLVLQLNPSLESGGKQPYQRNRVYDSNGIAPALCANKADLLIMVTEDSNIKSITEAINERKQGVYEALLKAFGKDNLVFIQKPRGFNDGIFESVDKSPSLTSNSFEHNNFLSNTEDFRIRRLTPREAARLQSIPESDIDIMLNCGVSDSQLYKIYGNGWNCEVVRHILSYLKL